MQTIIITSGVGGAGKSLVSAGLGLGLSQRGQRVAVLETGRRTLDVLLGEQSVYDMGDVLTGSAFLPKALVRVSDNLVMTAGTVGDRLTGSETRLQSHALDCQRFLGDNQTDYVIWEVPWEQRFMLDILCPAADQTILVCAPDAVSVRENRRVSDYVYRLGVPTTGVYVTPLPVQFARQRPIPDIDWLMDQVCAKLWGILPYHGDLLALDALYPKMKSVKQIYQPFDNFAQRIMGKYIDLWIS